MTTTTMNNMVEKSTKDVKKLFLQLKKGAEEAKLTKAYGTNGPLAEFAIDIIFPGASDEVFESLLSEDDTAKKIRKVYKFLLGTQVDSQGLRVTERFKELSYEMGYDSVSETFKAIAEEAKKDKKGNIEKIIAKVKSAGESNPDKGADKTASKIEEDVIAGDPLATPESEGVKGMVKGLSDSDVPTLLDIAKSGNNTKPQKEEA